ncbi:MAG: hypothetical protein LBM93_08890 [Oscillospiraceae bacterium]|jgi:hypothetical protein|nr:hypothetical protein [Oscillospiraceae bacterium]
MDYNENRGWGTEDGGLTDNSVTSLSGSEGFGGGVTVLSKRRIKKLPIIIAAAAVVVAAACALSYAFIPSVKNAVRLATMSPDKYFATVEKENFEGIAKDAADQYGALIDQLSGSQNVKANFALDVTEEGAKAMDMSEDFPDGMSIDGEMQVVFEKELLSVILSAAYNGTDLGTVNTLMDTEGLYIQYPELNETWLGVPMAEITGGMSTEDLVETFFTSMGLDVDGTDVVAAMETFEITDYLSPAELETFLNKYNGIIVDGFTDITLEKSKEVTIGGVTQKFTVVNSEMSSDDIKEVIINVLDALKEETFPVEIVEHFGIEEFNQRKYSGAMDIAIGYIEDEWDNLELDFDIVLETYVNSKGEIYGTDIGVEVGGGMSISAYALQALDNDKLGVEGGLKVKGMTGEGTYVPLSYEGTLDYSKDEKVSGTVDITIVTDLENSDSDITIPIDLKNVGVVSERGDVYPVGKISTVLSDEITDIGDVEISMDYSYDNGPGIEVTFGVDDEEYLSMSVSSEYDAAETLTAPDEYLGEKDEDEWLEGINKEKADEIFLALFGMTFDEYMEPDDDDWYTEYEDYDDYSDYSTDTEELSYDDGYIDGYDDGYLDGQYYDIYDSYAESMRIGSEEYENGYDDGYEDGYDDGLADRETLPEVSDNTQFTGGDEVTSWGGYSMGLYYGTSVGEYDALYGDPYGANYSDSNGQDTRYDEGYEIGYSQGYSQYAPGGMPETPSVGVSDTGTGEVTPLTTNKKPTKPAITNPLNEYNNGSVSTEPVATITTSFSTTTTVSITADGGNTSVTARTVTTTTTVTTTEEVTLNGHYYANTDVRVIVPQGYTASEESGMIEISNQDNLLSIQSEFPMTYSSASEIAALYTAAEMTVTSQNENFSIGGQSGYRIDFICDGIKGVVIYITTGNLAPYSIIYNGNDTALMEKVIESIEFK